jgi:hypothetical protein
MLVCVIPFKQVLGITFDFIISQEAVEPNYASFSVVVCLENVWGSGCIAPPILNLGTGWR